MDPFRFMSTELIWFKSWLISDLFRVSVTKFFCRTETQEEIIIISGSYTFVIGHTEGFCPRMFKCRLVAIEVRCWDGVPAAGFVFWFRHLSPIYDC